MYNLYGLPVIHDQEALSIVPAWSLQLARVLAARDAAIVAATGAVPEGDPETVAGMVARVGALEKLLADATIETPWSTAGFTPAPGWSVPSSGISRWKPFRMRRQGRWMHLNGVLNGPSSYGFDAHVGTVAPEFRPSRYWETARGGIFEDGRVITRETGSNRTAVAFSYPLD